MQPGEWIGPFQVEGRLGAGQMGVVYAVRRPDLDARYALKTLRRELCSTADLLRFQREVEHLAAVSSHPNVVPIHTAGEHKGALYYVMDLVEGETLQDLLDQGGPMAAPRAARYVRDLAGALAALHRVGVVHRDLKPANVLVDRRLDSARLADFGLARSFLDDRGRLTQTGELIGTPQFMAPEQALGHQVGPAADVYALGMVLFTLLAGQPAVRSDGKGLVALLTKVGSGELESLPRLAPGAPPDLVAIVTACLAFDPGVRPEAATVRRHLDDFLSAPPGQAPARRSAAGLAGLAVLAAGAATLALVAARATPPPAPPPPPPPPASPRPSEVTTAPEEVGGAAPRRAAAWLELVRRGDSASLDQVLKELDAAGPREETPEERAALIEALWDLDRAWQPASRETFIPPQLQPAQGIALERLVLIHLLLWQLVPDHRLPEQHAELLHPVLAMQVGKQLQQLGPRLLAGLTALKPDDVNVFVCFADANKIHQFGPQAEQVDLAVFRRGIQLARSADEPKAWGHLIRHLAGHLWARSGKPDERPARLDELRRLVDEAEALGWARPDVAAAMSHLQEALVPTAIAEGWHLPPAQTAEALAAARRAVALLPAEAQLRAMLVHALLAADPRANLAAARAELEVATGKELTRSEHLDTPLARATLSLAIALERQGDDAGAAAVCRQVVEGVPGLLLAPARLRLALLGCRLGDPAGAAAALDGLAAHASLRQRRDDDPLLRLREELGRLSAELRREEEPVQEPARRAEWLRQELARLAPNVGWPALGPGPY
ncbi:MAG: serine/threonine protein kinase [Planctomycetes bacterium]|nr:serine/threonine protein kinase [Planctomycetota bacterium]